MSVLITDPVVKCQHYESGDCVPQFDKEYSSIVTEVHVYIHVLIIHVGV